MHLTVTVQGETYRVFYIPPIPPCLTGDPDSWHPGDPGELEIEDQIDPPDWLLSKIREAAARAYAERIRQNLEQPNDE